MVTKEDQTIENAGEAPAQSSVGHTIPQDCDRRVPVVGLGASAGGIEALSQFFDAMPADSGAAFIVILHLDPTRASHLPSIMAHHTLMPVVEVQDGGTIAPNHVYVIAPNSDLTLDDCTLRLTEPAQPRGHRHPVDVLFRSLAEQRQERVVAIILSGTGSNGTDGLKEVRAAGGLILVQDPATTRFDGMPQSAIGAGLADAVLAPGAMPAAVMRYLRHDYVAAPERVAQVPEGDDSTLQQLLSALRYGAGQDFRHYKPGTVLRRIHRRMSLSGASDLSHYLAHVRADAGECAALVKDLLIGVTSFFRDPEAWAAIDETVVAQLVASRETGATIRVWVPGCSTGEEAYSIAMLLAERAEAAQKHFDIKIFASDVLGSNLDTGRAGVYPAASVEALSAERIRRFFTKLDSSYQVKRELRDMVVFARHDLLRDPPFSRMDLVTCRNLLIYIEPESQRRIVALLHFALRENGWLFLGNAESIGRADDLFEATSKKWRLYRRIGATRHDIVSFPVLGGGPEKLPDSPSMAAATSPARAAEIARRTILDRFGPAAVLIDRTARVLYFHGDTSDYLKQPSGEPTRDLMAMTREGLGRLRDAVQDVAAENREVTFGARIRRGETVRPVLVRLTPVPESPQGSGMVLVTFEPQARESAPLVQESEDSGHPWNAATAEAELRSTRAELQGTIGQLERVNEELKASNEEATSMNEELQSTNEELETSKEELQSFNEELHSVNNQLQHKVHELEEVSNDLANLLAGTEIATIFLDTQFRVKWFSPATQQLLDLVASDVGRPISHFSRKFLDDRLLGDAAMVLANLAPIEAEIRSDSGAWFLRRILPYRTRDDRIAGVVITFVNETERRLARDALNEARIYAEAIIETARQPLVVLDAGLRVRSANRAFYALLGVPPGSANQQAIFTVGNGGLDIPELRRLLEELLPQDRQIDDVQLTSGTMAGSQRIMLINARRLQWNGGRESMILMAIEDITAREAATAHREMLVGELNHRVKNMLTTVQALMSQTIRRSDSLEAFRTAFEGRLQAMAHAHDLIMQKNWAGAEIGQLVARTLAPYSSEDHSRIDAKGAHIMVRSQTGVSLVMILHELTTNAVKYGALSVPAGRLAVTWRRSEDESGSRISLQWRESGGPKVTPPARPGFGTRLIERSTSYELGGTAQLRYEEDGFCCDLDFPWTKPNPDDGQRFT